MQAHGRRRRGISPLIIMAVLGIGMMLVLPMLTGGESPLSGIVDKIKGFFGGGKKEAAASTQTTTSTTSSSSSSSPYAPRPLPAIPPIAQAPASSGDRFPVGQRGSAVRGLSVPATTSANPVAAAPSAPQPTRNTLETLSSASVLAPQSSSLSALQRDRDGAFAEVQASVLADDRARTERAYQALRRIDDRLAEAKKGAY